MHSPHHSLDRMQRPTHGGFPGAILNRRENGLRIAAIGSDRTQTAAEAADAVKCLAMDREGAISPSGDHQSPQTIPNP